MAAAYYMSVSIDNPIDALIYFFIAVLLVIIGTYLLFICGSVLLCKLLQKNKRYYYRKEHFISVSSMAYRMKRNGAGLASICILLTMVFVMISSTACLYFGAEDSLLMRYPREILLQLQASEKDLTTTQTEIDKLVERYRVTQSNLCDYNEYTTAGLLRGTDVILDESEVEGIISYSDLLDLHFISLADYNRATGKSVTLQSGEALIKYLHTEKKISELHINDIDITVVGSAEDLTVDGSAASLAVSTVFLIVDDIDETLEPLLSLQNEYGLPMVERSWVYGFDTNLEPEQQIALKNDIATVVMSQPFKNVKFSIGCRNEEHDDFFGTYGGFFFLGIMLSILFMVATVLIIYYKQISEGYEDQPRFGIMQKVGMNQKDIRRSIRSQMFTVFYLPILFSTLHLAFAFPIIRKLLMLFNVNNLSLFLGTTGISICLFAALYTAIYAITSNLYYDIVSGAKE
ncbi:MAG TPA: hypothetical protein DDY98_00135 [Ruminococcaceae bacterium]|nr:hypothetical protein [Oscillospiraceae bacterium]